MPDEDPGLSTGAVARLLGVSAATVRSWERRYGIGPAGRGAGQHRRYHHRDVDRLAHMCRLTSQGIPPAEAARLAVAPLPPDAAPDATPAAAPPRVPADSSGAACRGLARAAVRLDAVAMEHILAESLADRGVVDTWEQLAAPVLRSVGKKWAGSNGRYVEVEHLLSATISRSLHRAGPATAAQIFVGPPPGLVLLAGSPSDLHTLPLDALHAALLESGAPVLMLGASVPADALASAADRCDTRAVVVWSQHRPTADPGQLAELTTRLRGPAGARRSLRVHAAGPGWHGVPLAPDVLRLTDLRSAVTQLGRPGPADF
ncbi:MerR family transcriptional regulator [Streptacidiphilus sp. PAMC 29251]